MNVRQLVSKGQLKFLSEISPRQKRSAKKADLALLKVELDAIIGQTIHPENSSLKIRITRQAKIPNADV